MIKTCYIHFVYPCNKGFLITFGKLNFKQSSGIRSKCLTELHNAHSQVTNRGPTWILYLLLVVDKNGNDLLPQEGQGINRLRKRMERPFLQWYQNSKYMDTFRHIETPVTKYPNHSATLPHKNVTISAACMQYNIPYILDNPHPNLIRTSFCRFLKRKKKVSSRFQSAPFLQPPLAYKANWLNNIGCYQCFNRYPTNAPCAKWPFNCQRYKRTAANDSDWVTDSDWGMSDDGECGE